MFIRVATLIAAAVAPAEVSTSPYDSSRGAALLTATLSCPGSAEKCSCAPFDSIQALAHYLRETVWSRTLERGRRPVSDP
jgi:hypothetical protein